MAVAASGNAAAAAGPSRQPAEVAKAEPPLAGLERENILFLGLRRSGKSSIVNVVYKSLAPDDSLFLESTLRCQPCDIDTFQPMRLWDGTGAELESVAIGQGSQQQGLQDKGGGARHGSQNSPTKARDGVQTQRVPNSSERNGKGKAALGTNGQLHWTECGAVVFVIDSQDDWYDAIDRLHDVILDAYASNPLVHFHVFVHKVDGHSQDYRYDTLQQIERRVADSLAEASPSFVFAPTAYAIMQSTLAAGEGDEEEQEQNRSRWATMRDAAGMGSNGNGAGDDRRQTSGMGPDLEHDVRLSYHATSIYNADVLVACSRVQMELLNAEVRKTLDALCDGLCSSCKFEKVYLFDVPTRTYIAADASPHDESNFEAVSEYLSFLVQFSGLYRQLNEDSATDGDDAAKDVRYSSSAVRLSTDTTLGFSQVNAHLALAYVLRTDIHNKRAGMIDFNIAIARRAISEVYAACNE